jgi:antitoxin component YwqK of YwqJK toxin-antitoxin module
MSCRSETVTVTEDELTADIMYVKGTYKLFTGKCKVVFNNSAIIKEQFNFRNGILDGESIAWYRNGNLRRKGCYHNGHIAGKWIFWDENGHKTVEASYHLDSLTGPYISLYPNGKIKEKGHFKGNHQTGRWSYYDESGRLMFSSVK